MTAPLHLVRLGGEPRTLCGERDGYPRVLVRWAAAHVAGRGAELCQPCVAAAGEVPA